jgi:truncated hemoglobin YjbI
MFYVNNVLSEQYNSSPESVQFDKSVDKIVHIFYQRREQCFR